MPSDWTKLRQIMYQPSECWLSTEYSGDRWLTDQYVLLNVTELPELQELPDGAYKLTAGNGPVEREGAAPAPDIEAYFEKIARGFWFPAVPSEWSVAEHPGKAMLWSANGKPKLLGEPTWTQIKRHYPEAQAEVSNNLFRFSLVYHIDPYDDCAGDDGCGCEAVPFCYAAGIKIPDGEEHVASLIAADLDPAAVLV